MLKELYIENLAVIERMTVNFGVGLTVFTGETGAGKSILIDGINLVLGQRSSKDIVRTGTKRALVTAVFSDPDAQTLKKMEEFGYEAENQEIMISREISADGKSTARLMGRPVTVGILRELGCFLINIHGQHDNQLLLSSENHIDILDAYAGDQGSLERYQREYGIYVKLKNQYRKISIDEQEKARRIDLLAYQVDEISAVSPKPGEDEEIEQRLNVLRNSAKISENLAAAYSALYGIDGDGTGGYDMVQNAGTLLEEIRAYNSEIDKIGEQLDGVRYEIEEAAEKISSFLEKFDFDKGALDELEQRLDEIYGLKRKYGSSIEEILTFYENARAELESIQLSEQHQAELLSKMNVQKKVVVELGKELSELRLKAGKHFVEQVSGELKFLDMPNISLRVQLEKAKYGAKGCDEIEFLFSTNKGEELKSISKIASGGELSRIMLAIKSVLAEKDSIGTLIFDEIDAGVSGQSAQKIGLKLKSVAADRQILCVTHSAQIAALAQNHFQIKKQTEDERTYTRVFPLDLEGKIQEVARIMATDKITDLMLRNAREMIEAGNR